MRKFRPPYGPGPHPMGWHHGHGVFPWLFFIVFVLLAALAAVALVRTWRVPPRAGSAAATGPGPGGDPALAELRLRYARGDIGTPFWPLNAS